MLCSFILLSFLSISYFLKNSQTTTYATTSIHSFDVYVFVEDPNNPQTGFSQPSKNLTTITISFSNLGEHVETQNITTVSEHHHYHAELSMDGPWLGTRTESYDYNISLNIKEGYTYDLNYDGISSLSGTKTIVTGASNGNGANISACLAKGVNTASFAGGSASVDSCIYELNDPSKTKGRSSTFTKYSEWIYPSNFAYPMPKAFMWYPGAELSADSLNKWLGI